MAVKTNITINIVEPGSDVPVPDTGLFTHGIGSTETTIIVSAVLVTLLVILSIVLTTYMYRKHKKQGRTTKLVHIIDQTKAVVKSKKRVTIGLSIIALLVSACTFTAFMLNTNNSNTSAIEGNDTEQQTENTNNLTINTESKELTIEVKDQPVFAVLPVQVTVEEATQAGYTLTAYTDNTDLVSTTNPNNKIPMVTVEGDELTILKDNTWGLSLAEPEGKDSKVYTTLSTDVDNPTLLAEKEEATEANDTTTIYYGFYITPDMPYGTYTGGEVEYEAEENKVATVTFDGNGLYFNGDTSQTTNSVKYIPGSHSEYRYSHTPNINDNGQRTNDYGTNLSETFVYDFSNYEKIYLNIVKTQEDVCWGSYADFFSMWSGSHPEYTAINNWDDEDSITEYSNNKKYPFAKRYNNQEINIPNNIITIAYYTDSQEPACGMDAYGYYVKMLGYTPNTVAAGEYLLPSHEKSFRLLGWSEDKNATVPTYVNEEAIMRELNLSIDEGTTLYAVWEPAISLYYNGNGADETINMDNVVQYTANLSGTSQVDLLAPNFKKKGYGFVGWSTDQDTWDKLTDNNESNDSAIYGPNQMITIDNDLITKAGENRKLILYAVWAPAEKDSQGNPVYLQNWTGCSSLDKTIYNSTTDTLAVGKNTITALTDNRDNNIYTIARLADGNCWMTENLRLADIYIDENGETKPTVLTVQNTSNPHADNGIVALKNNDGTITNHLSPSSYEWCSSSEAECINQSYLDTRNTTETAISPSFTQDFTDNPHESGVDLSGNIYSYGHYYNLYSATVGNATYESSRGVSPGDICPSGWGLPTADYYYDNLNGSLYYLDSMIGGGMHDYGGSYGWLSNPKNWRSFPNNFLYSGFGYSANRDGRGSYGYYITSTIGWGSMNMLNLRVNDVSPGNSGASASSAAAVRCLIK